MVILSICLSVRHDPLPFQDQLRYRLQVFTVFFIVFRDKISCHWVRGSPELKCEWGATLLKRCYFTDIGSSSVKMVADSHKHAAHHNKHWQRTSYKCQHRWPWMTLNPQNRGLYWIFRNFGLRHAFQKWIALKWLEIDKDNLHMKFSALNVDFSSPSPDPLDSKRPAHASVKKGVPF